MCSWRAYYYFIIMYAGMLIYIRSGVRIFPLVVEASDTIETVKDKIKMLRGMPPKNQMLLFAEKELRDGHTLSDYGVYHGSPIYLIYRTTCHHIQLIGMLLIRSAYMLCMYINWICFIAACPYVCGPAWIQSLSMKSRFESQCNSVWLRRANCVIMLCQVIIFIQVEKFQHLRLLQSWS